MNINDLHSRIAAVCPIHGVDSNGNISFKAEATPEQRQAAADVVANYDPAAVEAERLTKLAALDSRMIATVNDLNATYPGLDLEATDSIADAAGKMIAAGLEWSVVDTYGARLRLIAEAIDQLR